MKIGDVMDQLERPAAAAPHAAFESWRALPSFIPVPQLGVLAVNAFLLKGKEPVLVDTGLAALRAPFLSALENEVDLDDLRWIWISHADPDHVGNLDAVLQRAPRAQIVTSFLGAAKLGLLGHPQERMRVLNPGEALDLPDRRLTPLRPPYYDAPETLGFLDGKTRALFAADSFGAVLPAPESELDAIDPCTVREGMASWSAIDAPWLAIADRDALDATLSALGGLQPAAILSAHLPMARSGPDGLIRHVRSLWTQDRPAAADPVSIDHLAAA